MRNAQPTAMWFVSMNLALWNFGRYTVYVGLEKDIHKEYGPAIRRRPELNNCWHSMMYTRMHWPEQYINEKQVRIYCRPGNGFEIVIM
jgi:hypothetical protein